MRRHARPRLIVAAALVTCAVALAGCASSSNTASSGAGAGNTSPPASSSPATSTTGPATTTGSATSPQGGPSALSVNPTVGSTQSVMRFSFASPTGTAAQTSTQTSSALSIVGPHKTGCVGIHDEPVPSAPVGHMVNVAVGPAQLGGAWCPGAYTARVEVVQRPRCAPGMMCPQFIRVVAVLGPVLFRISG